jgi:hypothetical protein
MTPTTPVTNLFADLHYRWAAPTAQRFFWGNEDGR